MNASGTNASPDDTVITVADGCFFKCSMNADVTRIGPRKFVTTIDSIALSSTGFSTMSADMIPHC